MLIEPPTKAEEALWEIITSPIYFPDFAWKDVNGVDPYRVRDYQYPLTQDTKFLTGEFARDTGKTESIKRLAATKMFSDVGADMLITAPNEVHLRPLMESLIERVEKCKLTASMLKGRPIRKPDYVIGFYSFKIYGRIPGVKGNNVKGMHSNTIVVDEGQDYFEDGWNNIWACLNEVPHSQFRVFGVHNGVRNQYYTITKDQSWVRVSVTAMHRYSWCTQERRKNINLYGSRRAPAYVRNVLAEAGDAEYPVFLHDRFMMNVDLGVKESNGRRNSDIPEYTQDYVYLRLQGERVVGNPKDFIRIYPQHLKYDYIVAGIDMGYISDPTEITIWASALIGNSPRYKLIYRIRLERFDEDHQELICEKLLDNIPQLKVMAFDSTGRGASLYERLRKKYKQRVTGTPFNASVTIVHKEDGSKRIRKSDEVIEQVQINKPMKQVSTERIQNMIDNRMLMIPYDIELIGDLLAQRELPLKNGRCEYECDSKFEDHLLDSMRAIFYAVETHYGEEEKPREAVIGRWYGRKNIPGSFQVH